MIRRTVFARRLSMTLNQSCTKDALYLLAEIKDDLIIANNEETLKDLWYDDCLEIFGSLLLEE